MRKIFLTICAVAVSVSAMAGGRLELGSVKSEILGVEKPYAVYLPDGYDKSTESYPVLYLLHGATDTFMAWPERGDMKRIADQTLKGKDVRKMIIVMPDASGKGERNAGRDMGYFNVEGWSYEDFFFKEFMLHIDATYRTIAAKEGRAIAGLSMGGYGTMFYTMRHPELFSSACPISARMSGTPYNKNRSYTDEYITTLDSLAGVKIAQSLSDEQIAALRLVRLRVDCGDDDYLFDGNVDFVRALRSHKIPVEFRVRDGGHSWIYWQTALPDILTYVSIGFME